MSKNKIPDDIRDTNLVILAVPNKIDTAIKNIAFNCDNTKSHFLRLEFRKIVDSYPDAMKTGDSKNMAGINITGFDPKVKKQIYAIAKHLGVAPRSFMKMKLKEIIDSYPEKYQHVFKD